jgi:hypothetical protein
MNCFHHSISVKAEIARSYSKFQDLAESGNVPIGAVIRQCLSEISPDHPERGLAAAKVMQCALREILQQDRVKRSLAEYYGVNYLLTSLTQAIAAYENFGRINELMFVSMRIGRELSSYQNTSFSEPVPRIM